MPRRLLALVVTVALALTGCVTVPTRGPVERVSAVPGRVNSGVEIAPAPPRPGASPVTIIEGFLHAMAAHQLGYDVARAYLTPRASAGWDPESGARIYAGGSPVSVSDDRATLRASVVGTIDADGGYRQSDDVVEHDFGLVKDDQGQWRIGHPPEGLLISEYLFPSAFTRVVVYFPAVDGGWLVPDPRFFPRGEQAHQRAAAAVMKGATAWLAPTVRVSHRGATLDAVAVDASGLASITLKRGAVELDAASRATLAAQFAWTFRQFETVNSVQIGWAGEEAWAIAPHGRIAPTSAFADADPVDRQGSRQLFGLARGRLVRVMDDVPPAEHIPAAPGITGASTAAVRADAVVAAAVTDQRHLALAPLSEPGGQAVETPEELRRLAFSRQGELWASDAAGRLLTRDAGGSWQTIAVDGLGTARVMGFRLAPDGARVALLIARADGGRTLAVARIVRDRGVIRVEDGRPLDVAEGAIGPVSVLDAGWRTPDTLLALVSDGRATQVLAVAQDGASVTPVGTVAGTNLVELAVAPGMPPVARAADGELWRYSSDFRWSAQPSDLSSVFYPG